MTVAAKKLAKAATQKDKTVISQDVSCLFAINYIASIM